jgi:RNA polymerase sigma-70 factor, ECF subfamily
MTQEAKIEENPHKSDSTKEEFVADLDTYREKAMTNSNAVSPDAMHRQMTKLLEAAIAKLPESFRVVLMLREVEGLSVDETAEVLQIPKDTVKTRLVEARHKLQQEIDSKLRNALHDTFTFAGSDCDALTERVLATVYSKWA